MSTHDHTHDAGKSRKPLSADEAAVLDGVIARLSANDRVPADPAKLLDVDPSCEQGKRALGWMKVIGHCPCDTPAVDLAKRTMARVNESRLRQKFTRPATGWRTRSASWTWAEFGAVAAMLVIGFVLLWPVVHRTPQDTARLAGGAGGNSLNMAGQSMGTYGNSLTSLFKSPWNTPPTLSTPADSFNAYNPSPTEPRAGLLRIEPFNPLQPDGRRLLTIAVPDAANSPDYGLSGLQQGAGQYLNIQRPDGMRLRIQLPADAHVRWSDNPAGPGGIWIIRGTFPAANQTDNK
ncbi:MAG: hypothetical protein K8S99_05710 [Planctomycetes bacterium]|nr:hypothetical protein [Planctomycetota bacterium]